MKVLMKIKWDFIKKLLRYKLQKDFGGIYVPDVKSRIKKIKLYTISDIEHQWNSVTLSQRTGETDMSGKQISIFSLYFRHNRLIQIYQNLH